MKKAFWLFFISYLALCSNCSAEMKGAVFSWKELRDKEVVKQQFDYSCGAASIATVLKHRFYMSVDEKEVIENLASNQEYDNGISFSDMKNVFENFRFTAKGYKVKWEELKSITMPMIVYTAKKGEGHFSVFKKIENEKIYLADPSLGNRLLTKKQFLAEFEGKDGFGKILIVDGNERTLSLHSKGAVGFSL